MVGRSRSARAQHVTLPYPTLPYPTLPYFPLTLLILLILLILVILVIVLIGSWHHQQRFHCFDRCPLKGVHTAVLLVHTQRDSGNVRCDGNVPKVPSFRQNLLARTFRIVPGLRLALFHTSDSSLSTNRSFTDRSSTDTSSRSTTVSP